MSQVWCSGRRSTESGRTDGDNTHSHHALTRPRYCKLRTLFVALLASLGGTSASLSLATSAGALGTALFVSSGGTNSGGCASSSDPCATVSYALSQASTGDEIEVAGTIQDNITVSSLSSLTIAQWPAQSSAVIAGQAREGSVITVSSGGLVTIDGVTVENGSGSLGGGITNDSSTVTIDDSTISDNSTTSEAGGIYNRYGTLNVVDSAFTGNTTRFFGGAIFNFEGTATISNSTFAGNTSETDGDAIGNDLGTVTVDSSTISGDTSSAVWSNGSMTLAADIVATAGGPPVGGECTGGGVFTDAGYNVDDDATCNFSAGQNSVSDSTTIEQYLGPLENNGGSTDTIALLPGNGASPNPAEHAIPSSFDLPGGTSACAQPDQRGVTRQIPCDIGAYALLELFALPDGTASAPCTTESSTASSVCSLETAITEADGDAYDVVNLEAPTGNALYTGVGGTGVTETISAPLALQADPDVGFDTTTPTLDGEGSEGVLAVTANVDVSVTGVAIENGARSGSPGSAILNGGTGTLTVASSTFLDNFGGGGGALSNSAGGTLDVSASTFQGNLSDGGGAIANGDFGSGTLNVTDSTFVDNGANNYSGGAILNGFASGGDGTASITDSTFDGNTANFDDGGAIDNGGAGGTGTITVTGSTFSDTPGEVQSNSGSVTVAGDVFVNDCGQQGETWLDDGYNVGSDTSCFNGGTGDDAAGSGLSSLLGPLADNGGPTETMELLTGNPGIGIIPDPTIGLCPVASDQRGSPSPTGDSCDAGAVQLLAAQSIGSLSTAPTDAVVGGATYTPSASAFSALPVSITVDPSTSSECSISGGGSVSFTAIGTCELDFNQSGNSEWDAASQVQQTFTVSPHVPSSPLDATATASGLTPAFATTVSWSSPASDGGSSVSAYTVVPDDLTSSETGTAKHVSGSANSAAMSGLVAGDLYDFLVTASNAGGDGPSATTNMVVPVGVTPSGPFDVDTASSDNTRGHVSVSLGSSGQPGSISSTAWGSGTVSVSIYPSNPIPRVKAEGTFYDMSVAPGQSFDHLTFTVCGVPVDAQLSWWDPYGTSGAFVAVSTQSTSTGAGSCVTATIDDSTSPTLSELVGTVIEVPSATPEPNGRGYSLVASDGGVFAYGDAHYEGSRAGQSLNAPIVGIASTPDGKGYWLVASDGGVFAYGDADYEGSRAGQSLNAPIVGIASTPDGKGYWLVASDGGVFAYGDAHYEGSRAGQSLNAPIVGIASTPDGKGYWLVASDGGVFAYGDADYEGSRAGQSLNAPIVGIASTPDGKGYWLVASDGGVFAYGDAHYEGSRAGQSLNVPIVGIAPRQTARATGWWLLTVGSSPTATRTTKGPERGSP